jgi:hypothetical protein
MSSRSPAICGAADLVLGDAQLHCGLVRHVQSLLGVLLGDARGVLKPRQCIVTRPIQSVAGVGELNNLGRRHDTTSLSDGLTARKTDKSRFDKPVSIACGFHMWTG